MQAIKEKQGSLLGIRIRRHSLPPAEMAHCDAVTQLSREQAAPKGKTDLTAELGYRFGSGRMTNATTLRNESSRGNELHFLICKLLKFTCFFPFLILAVFDLVLEVYAP